MKTTLEQVKEFHEAFGVPNKNAPDLSDPKINELRINLIAEELEELKEAIAAGDIVETLDALTDIQYVLDGTYLSLGLHSLKDIAFAEVQASNMSKLGADGKPIYRPEDNKVMKGPNYFKPDLAQILKQAGFLKDEAA